MEEVLLRYIKGIATSDERCEVLAWIERDEENLLVYDAMLTAYIVSIWNDPEL